MYTITHTPTSLIIGLQASNPIISFLLAIIAHFILDLPAHHPRIEKEWMKTNKLKKIILVSGIDIILALFLLSILFFNSKLFFTHSMIWALIGGILPDILWGINLLTQKRVKILDKYHQFHHDVHLFLVPKIHVGLRQVIILQSSFFILILLIYLRLV